MGYHVARFRASLRKNSHFISPLIIVLIFCLLFYVAFTGHSGGTVPIEESAHLAIPTIGPLSESMRGSVKTRVVNEDDVGILSNTKGGDDQEREEDMNVHGSDRSTDE